MWNKESILALTEESWNALSSEEKAEIITTFRTELASGI